MNVPLVSIGFPIYNGEAFLKRALDAILSQDFRDFELVISDNASSDSTRAICESYATRDKRISYFRNEENIGVNRNHDRVFQLSRGKYFMWTAHDVELLPGMLGRCAEVMRQAPPSVVSVYPRCETILDGQILPYEPRNSIQSRDPRPHRRMENVIRRVFLVDQMYGLMKREALAQTQLNGDYPSSDYVLLAELAMLGEIWEIPETLIRRRIDSNRGTPAVCRDATAWMTWLNPNARKLKRAWLPYRERLALEYFRAAWRIPLRPADKFRCLFIAPVLPYWRRILRITGPLRHRLRNARPPATLRANEIRNSFPE